MSTGKRQLAAIMFTDVVGYTALMSKDEKKALAILEKVRETLKPLISQYHGKWLKEMGDGSLSSFHSASDAVICALAFQRALISETDFKIRIGIHVGEVVFTEDDVYGDGVNIASRIEPLAPPGGIYISGRVYEDIHNKPEMEAVFVGDRKLKNLDNPIKVYTLVGEGLPEPPDQSFTHGFKDRLQNLWERRLPQILASYLVASYFMVQLAEWILGQYAISPYWADISGVFLLSCLPSVAVIAYFHGKSGPEKWVKAEKLTIPLNVVFTFSLLFFVFQGKELGATAKTVTVVDEEGKSIQRVIPKTAFMKEVGLFFFENRTDDPSLDWIAAAIPTMLEFDLGQEPYISSKNTFEFVEEIQRAKANIYNIPSSLMRKVAKDYRMDYYLAGSFDKEKKDYVFEYQLFQTDNGKLVASQQMVGPNIFDLTDRITLSLKNDLELSEAHIDQTRDLPLATTMTKSEAAMKVFVEGLIVQSLQNDYDQAIQLIEKAVEIDPSFAYAYFHLMAFNINSSRFEAGNRYMAKTMEYLYVLPEPQQFLAKYINYSLYENTEKGIKVLKMWQELYPEDLEPRKKIGEFYYYSGKLEEAERVFENALKIGDDRGNFYALLAEIKMTQQKFDQALAYYQQYATKYPDHARSFQLMGDYYFDRGKFQKAFENYEKASFLSSDDAGILGKLAEVRERQGEFNQAKSEYLSILARCKTTQDSMAIYKHLQNFHFNRGEINQGIDYKTKRLELAEKIWVPLTLSIRKITRLNWYFEVGRTQEALEIIEEVRAEISEGLFEDMIAFGDILYHLHQNELEKARTDLEKIHRHVDQYGSAGNIEIFYDGEVAYWEGNYSQALENYRKFQAGSRMEKNFVENRIARSLIQLKDYPQAKKTLDQLIKLYPYDPEAHYQLGLIKEIMGKNGEAKEHLEISLKVWENADPEYQIAADARKKLEELTNS